MICFDAELFYFNKLLGYCKADDVQINPSSCHWNTGKAFKTDITNAQRGCLERQVLQAVPSPATLWGIPGQLQDSALLPPALRALEAPDQEKHKCSKGIPACATSEGLAAYMGFQSSRREDHRKRLNRSLLWNNSTPMYLQILHWAVVTAAEMWISWWPVWLWTVPPSPIPDEPSNGSFLHQTFPIISPR